MTLSDQAQQLASETRFGEAERLWKQAIGASPDYFPALFNLGYLYFTQQRFAEAAPLLQRSAEIGVDDFNSHYVFGVTLSKLGKTDAALRAWREALRIQPKNLRLMQIMAVEYSKGRYFGEAAALGRRALNLKSDDLNIYFLAIKAHQDAGDDTSAGDIARSAVEKFPNSARANFEFAYQLQKKGKIKEAEQGYQLAIQADPSYEEPFFFYANLLVDNDRSTEAIPFLRAAIQNRSDYIPARVLLARALMNENKLAEAITELEAAIALAPKHPQPHLLLSQLYFRSGEEAKAKSEKDISLRLRRENPTILEAAQPRPFPAK